MDINLILDLTTLSSKSDYSSTFTPALEVANTTCTVFDFAALGIDIEQLREKLGGQRCNAISVSSTTVWIIVIVVIIVIAILAVVG